MKALYFIALSLLIVSCKNQGKMDLEAAKLLILWKLQWKSKRVIDAGGNDKVEMQKETIIVNQPEITQRLLRPLQKERLGSTAKGAVIGAELVQLLERL
jgi:hypothetical protein